MSLGLLFFPVIPCQRDTMRVRKIIHKLSAEITTTVFCRGHSCLAIYYQRKCIIDPNSLNPDRGHSPHARPFICYSNLHPSHPLPPRTILLDSWPLIFICEHRKSRCGLRHGGVARTKVLLEMMASLPRSVSPACGGRGVGRGARGATTGARDGLGTTPTSPSPTPGGGFLF